MYNVLEFNYLKFLQFYLHTKFKSFYQSLLNGLPMGKTKQKKSQPFLLISQKESPLFIYII